ncbi:ATP-binding protein [SAR92 clade bacterium H455]|uniref:histidine kinase n=1 Tax=SAR92 clade bacterium H455 TaxID=2974818 RepID=A0ABY5TKT4_9GAMM|nr:ATP-binding protein [SAR92 clade bacterium H455]
MEKAQPNNNNATRENLYVLSLIRGVALLGQVLALIYFTWVQPIGLPVAEIAFVLSVYGSLTAAIWVRSRRAVPIGDKEFFVHLLADIAFFSILLFFSGGASNPFVSYLLIPISIAAITLSRGYSIAIAVIALLCYSLLLKYYVAIAAIAPGHHQAASNSLHILGMLANFAISATIIIYFISRMAAILKQQEQEIAMRRDAQLRDEQLLAVGTLAAGTAHELGTPLNTMKLIIDEMLLDTDNQADVALLNQQIEQCKTTLKQLLTTAEESQSNQLKAQPVQLYLDNVLARWQLMRPLLKTHIQYTDNPAVNAVFHPTIAQSILNLLNNAADASEKVDIEISWDTETATIRIRDFGVGLDAAKLKNLGQPFVTDKAGGLGLGLFLSQATLTRFGGSVSLQNAPEGGTLTQINLPLLATAAVS